MLKQLFLTARTAYRVARIRRCPARLARRRERCDLVAGHGGLHRHRPLGQTTIVYLWA